MDINGNADISGNLTVGGDFTTLNTTLREVELLHVDANSSATAGIITQRGSGDILNLFDTTTEVMTVVDGGKVGIGTVNPTSLLTVGARPKTTSAAATVLISPASGDASIQMRGGSPTIEFDSTGGGNGRIFTDSADLTISNGTLDGAGDERLRITNDGTIYSYSPDDATPNIAIRSNDSNWHGYLTQTVHGGSISSILSCGGKWSVDGSTYSATKDYNGSFPTSALVLHNQYNGSNGTHLVFLDKASGSPTTDGTVSERFRINQHGTITNTTTSSHSQGAGTFNVKGVINQYSQGSGSGLIFDCDFGRLTGYGDDTNVGNGTNLSACLSHSTTDWTSSNSNTPITVNGGTFQYRVGFGGYFDAISNGGRVSIAAGSGSPNMASTLNTTNMTIESWVWYDGDGREVIVSRYGTSFPAQFNMLADPNGQFHYNSGGVGASGGNVSGEHFPDKTWHHHLWQYESGVHRWYINGAFANSRSAGSSVAVNSGTGFAIFSRADRMEDWRGKIALVRIYNRALSAAEIKNHFELERGRFGV